MLRSGIGTLLTYFLYIIHTFQGIKKQNGQQIFPLSNLDHSWGSGADHPFENSFPVFYFNSEPLDRPGFFFLPLSLKQHLIYQMLPPEVMKMEVLPISIKYMQIILPFPCKDPIRVSIHGVQNVLQLSGDPIGIALPVYIEFPVFAGDL